MHEDLGLPGSSFFLLNFDVKLKFWLPIIQNVVICVAQGPKQAEISLETRTTNNNGQTRGVMKMKRFLGNFAKTYLVLGVLSVSAYAGADDYAYHQQGGDVNCAPQCAPVCCEAPCHEAPHCGVGYNPCARFDCGTGCSHNFGLRVDFLWWRACADGTELGYEETISSTPAGYGQEAFQTLSLRRPGEEFEPGFRIGLNYFSPCCCWDAALNYTHFHTTAKAKGFSNVTTPMFSATDFTAFRPLWESVDNSVPGFASSKYILDLDYLDLEIGHKYYVSACFVLRPFVGLRGARINQKYRYDASANRASAVIPVSSNHFNNLTKAKNNFLGAGPRVGLDVEFDFGCNVVLFGQAGGSILFGRFENHSNENYIDFAGATSAYRFNQHAPSERCSGTISDLAIGLKWEHCFCYCNTQYPVSLAFAWEHHGFHDFAGFGFNKNVITYDTSETPEVLPTSNANNVEQKDRGAIYTQGLTVSANFGF